MALSSKRKIVIGMTLLAAGAVTAWRWSRSGAQVLPTPVADTVPEPSVPDLSPRPPQPREIDRSKLARPAQRPETRLVIDPKAPTIENAAPAYPHPTPAAAEERDEKVKQLKESGPAPAAQRQEHLARLEEVRREWADLALKDGQDLDITSWQCYAGGCTATVRYDAVDQAGRFRQLAIDAPTSRKWRGGGFLSGPVQTTSGGIEITWIFYTPPKTAL